MQKAQEEFNTKALIFGMQQAELESTKLAKEVRNVGIVMDTIPESGLAASLGVQQLAMNMQSAAYKAAEFEASMKAVWNNMQTQGTMVMNQFVSNLARASEESGLIRNKVLQDTLK